MVAKQITETAGGMLPAIVIAAVSGNPELVPAEVASEAGADISAVATTANKIAGTLEKLKETREIDQAQVDQVHVLIERPEGIDEGAVHFSEAQYHEPNDEVELLHPAGEKYS